MVYMWMIHHLHVNWSKVNWLNCLIDSNWLWKIKKKRHFVWLTTGILSIMNVDLPLWETIQTCEQRTQLKTNDSQLTYIRVWINIVNVNNNIKTLYYFIMYRLLDINIVFSIKRHFSFSLRFLSKSFPLSKVLLTIV